jgi:DNA polymerase-3 subunit epsilon
MPHQAEAVHGLSAAFLSDKPKFVEKAEQFLEFIGDSPLVAHNAGFDFGFVNMELEACGLEPLSRDRMIDTVALARVRHPGAKNSLDALCTRYGIDRSHRTKHGALLDAELLAQVYVELTGGRQIGLELAADTTDTLVASISVIQRERPFRPARPHSASPEELAAHADLMTTFPSPAWGAQADRTQE